MPMALRGIGAIAALQGAGSAIFYGQGSRAPMSFVFPMAFAILLAIGFPLRSAADASDAS